MAEVSFHSEIQSLRLGDGDTFYGEGILGVTKALLQSGVAYVGGYQGAPVTHLLDVLVQSGEMLEELGIHLETCTSEAAAAAMLGASINYPLRGAVTWKSIVGTNVAADALSNLASAGVMGGAMIIVGEDYGEGASVIQERTHAMALKSSLWLLDPRPELPSIVRMVEKGFELSEVSNTPVILELRVRACHVFGAFEAKDNVAPRFSAKHRLAPAKFNYDRLSHPPVIFPQEIAKFEKRLPAARKFIQEHKLNERLGPERGDLGIIVQGGLFNALNSRLALAGLSDVYGDVQIPTLVLNVTHPLVPEEVSGFCAGKRAVLLVEEGAPDFIEQAVGQLLRKADLNTKLHGKDFLAMAGEYTPLVLGRGLAQFLAAYGRKNDALEAWVAGVDGRKTEAAKALTTALPPRPPTFCTGCPERPVFSAMKILKKEMGPVHVAVDIGCHALATFPPFSQGNSILGYGMSLASAAAVSETQEKRPISIMGDGGFWHNGMLTGVASAVLNKNELGPDRDEQRLFQRDRATGPALERAGRRRPRQGSRHRRSDEGARRRLDQAGAHLRGRGRREDAARRGADVGRRPEGHHRRRRMPACAPAPYPTGTRAVISRRKTRRASALLGRPRRLHRRPFLHSSIGLSVPDGEAERGSAADGSGGAREQ